MIHGCFLDFIFQRRKETGSQELDFLEKVDEEFDKGVMNFPMLTNIPCRLVVHDLVLEDNRF
jgi:hypothetical protein